MSEMVNGILGPQLFRTFLIMVTGVFAGYTLQPVPKWLSHMFDRSFLLKFMILFSWGCVILYPLSNTSIMIIFICTLLTLTLFEILRRMG
jgi:hypothetical protein